MPLYECPKCGRTVEKPRGKYYCAICGREAEMKELTSEEVKTKYGALRVKPTLKAVVAEEPMAFLQRHPSMHAVWSVLDLDKTLSPTTKNVLWQDFVAAWNRRRLITNEQAELLLKLRW